MRESLFKNIHQIKLVYLVNIQLLFIIEHLFIQLYVNGRINSPEYTTQFVFSVFQNFFLPFFFSFPWFRGKKKIYNNNKTSFPSSDAYQLTFIILSKLNHHFNFQFN